MTKGILGAKPQLFLRKLLAHYPDLTFSVSHKVIAERFSMPPSTVAKYLKLLVSSGYIIQQKNKDIFKGKGIAKYQYQISKAGVKLLNSSAPSNSAHQYLITKIQSDDFKNNLKQQYKKCTFLEGGKRFAVNIDDCIPLLAILLSQANQYGVVLGLTRSDLSNLVGFKTAKIQRLTKVLLSLGLIAHVTPGISGFFGIQPSIYQLHLNHPLYAKDQQMPTVDVRLIYPAGLKPPATQLFTKILASMNINTDPTKGLHIKPTNELDQKSLETINVLKTNLTGSKPKIRAYCNGLMMLFTNQIIHKCADSGEIIQFLTHRGNDEKNDSKVNGFNDLKEFINNSLLSKTTKINNLSKIVSTFLPFFLGHILHIASLLHELERLGYRKLVLINANTKTLNSDLLNVSLTFKSKLPSKEIECSNYFAHMQTDRQKKQIKVRVTPNQKE